MKRDIVALSLVPATFVYVFPAVVDDWHDGDTARCHRGLAPGIILHGERVRIQGINAPELATVAGKAALAHALALAPSGTSVLLTSSKEEKFGRFLARMTLPDGTDFGDRMIADGFAVPFLA